MHNLVPLAVAFLGAWIILIVWAILSGDFDD